MNCSDEIRICLSLPEYLRRQAAEIMYDAFQREFRPLLGTRGKGVAILEKSLCPQSVIAALCGERLVGVAGIQYSGRRLFEIRPAVFFHEYGWLKGLIRLVPFSFYAAPARGPHIHVVGLAVDATFRNRGVGSRLLEAVFDLAREKGIAAVDLDVIDTNPDARRLYERMGFVVIKTNYYPYLRRLMGFSASFTMRKTLA